MRKNMVQFRILCFLLTAAFLAGLFPGRVLAAGQETSKSELRIADYPEGNFKFVYDDTWFAESSYTYNPHLATLSMLLAQQSHAEETAMEMFKAMEFEDVTGNGYYGLAEGRPESVAVMAAHKTVQADGEDVTLIGMTVRSYDYGLEWEGNFTIGQNALHEGFKTARDEALRFLKKYVTDNNITGRVKLWIGGHSRGSAVTNLLAAYLAVDQGDYISGLSIDPEDIYAYGFATPGTVVEGSLTKGEMMDVAAARTEKLYKQDTPGKAFTYKGSDSADLISSTDEVFSGIHNVDPAEDLITSLPLKSWGYTIFGTHEEQQYITDQDSMLYYMELIAGKDSADGYRKYGGPENYKWMTLDIHELKLVEDENATAPVSQKDFFPERMETMHESIGDYQNYVTDNYQTMLSSTVCLGACLESKIAKELTSDLTSLIKTGVFTYISYVQQWYKEKKGVDLSDGEAAEIVLAAVFEMVIGEKIDPEQTTIDDMIYYLCLYVAENTIQQKNPEDEYDVLGYEYKTKLAEKLHNILAQAVNSVLKGDETTLPGVLDTVYTMMYNGAYGAEGSPETATGKDDGREDRKTLYTLIGFGLQSNYPDIVAAIGSDGSNRAYVLMDAVLPLLMKTEGEGGQTITYTTAEDAANGMIGRVLENALNKLFDTGTIPSTGVRADCFREYVKRISENPEELRRFVTGILLSTDGDEFDIPGQIRNAATLLGQANAILYTHLYYTYTAWLLSQDDLYPVVQNSAEEKEYEEPVSVKLTTDKNATLYYTLDGTEPTEKSKKYSGPIQLKQTDKKQKITLKVIGVLNGKAGRVWEFTYVIEPPVTYKVVKGDGGEWTEGSGKGLSFTAKRSCHDEKTIDAFTGISVGGKTVDPEYYTKKKGSVILTLSPDYLGTLKPGEYTLTVSFEDADPAEATFRILEKEEPEDPEEEDPEEGKEKDPDKKDDEKEGGEETDQPDEPKKSADDVKTGDDTPVLPLTIVMFASLLAMGGILVFKRKNNRLR